MEEGSADSLLAAFRAHTLPKFEWTHEAHLIVCWCVLRDHDVDETVDDLRDAIRSYNKATGGSNTQSSGYHETLTRYYVEAVAQFAGQPLSAVLSSPTCTREAPARHWTRELLFTAEARAKWVEPDVAALPWAMSGAAVPG